MVSESYILEGMNKITQLTEQEFAQQRDTLNLIASENYPSPAVLKLLGSVWQNRYSEGSPGKRYYAGQVNTDALELYVQELALKAFDTTGEYGVNVQLLSGSPANTMVYFATLQPGDTILSLNLANGGHLSHLHETSAFNKFYNHATYDISLVGEDSYEVDLEDFAKQLTKHKPQLTIIGFSAYPRAYKFAKMCRLAHDAGSLVLADVAHINGLIAAGVHDSPFKAGLEGADFVSMTTHKTMRGPRGALLFAKSEQMENLNKTVFPGTSGGPHMHTIAATGQALLEILGEEKYPDNIDFKTYAQTILDTCRALEKGLIKGGLSIVSPTQTHLSLVRLPDEIDSLDLQKKLEDIGIIMNRNMIPFDTKSAWRPSGMRLGTAALTSRGLTEGQAETLGELITAFSLGNASPNETRQAVGKLVSSLKWYY